MEGDDPVTMAGAAAAGGSALAAGGSVMGGMQAKSAARIQGEEDIRQGQLAEQQAGAEISSNDTKAIRALGADAANAGASGVTQSTAAPVMTENATQAQIKDMYSRYSGKLAMSSDQYAANLATYQGNQAMWKGLFGGAQNILGGAGDVANIKMFENLKVRSGSSFDPYSLESPAN
jgi:hypothetical protein